MAGFLKASPTASRGLDDLAANVLLPPIGLGASLAVLFAAVGRRDIPFVGLDDFDGVVSTAVFLAFVMLCALFGTYELTARRFGVALVGDTGRFVGDVALGAIDGIGGRWPRLVTGRDRPTDEGGRDGVPAGLSG